MPDSYLRIEVEPLTPGIGATVYGVDLGKPLEDDVVEEIHDAWMRHLVLFLRDQHMSSEQHLAFGRRFGELHIHPAAPYAHNEPALMVIHTDKDSHRNNGSGWHSDVSADEEPPLGSILHLHEVPSEGGDTLFANMYAAYESLSEPMRAFLEYATGRVRHDEAPRDARCLVLQSSLPVSGLSGRRSSHSGGGASSRTTSPKRRPRCTPPVSGQST